MNTTDCRRCREGEGAGAARPLCTLFVHFDITSSDLKHHTRHVTAWHIKQMHKMASQGWKGIGVLSTKAHQQLLHCWCGHTCL